MKWLKLFVHVVLIRGFLKIFCGVNVKGGDYFRHLDQFILCANHNSHFDTLLLYSILPVGRILKTRPVADREYFSRRPWLFKAADWLFQPIWIDRGKGSGRLAVDSIIAHLDRGSSIIIFPEGTRGNPSAILPVKSGIARIALKRPQIPILPAFLSGPERVLPKSAFLPLPFWNQVVVGPPRLMSGGPRRIKEDLDFVFQELSHDACVRRQETAPPRNRVKHILAVVGIDGSGKSEQSRNLAENLSLEGPACWIGDRIVFFDRKKAAHVPSPLIEAARRRWNKQVKRSKSLGSYRAPKLMEMMMREWLLKEIVRWYPVRWIVMDGMPLINLSAWAGVYSKAALMEPDYARLLDFLTGQTATMEARRQLNQRFPEIRWFARLGWNRLTIPDFTVFLDVRPETACQRIQNRAELRQPHESVEILSKLRQGYEFVSRTLCETSSMNMARMDGEQSLEVLKRILLDRCVEEFELEHPCLPKSMS